MYRLPHEKPLGHGRRHSVLGLNPYTNMMDGLILPPKMSFVAARAMMCA